MSNMVITTLMVTNMVKTSSKWNKRFKRYAHKMFSSTHHITHHPILSETGFELWNSLFDFDEFFFIQTRISHRKSSTRVPL